MHSLSVDGRTARELQQRSVAWSVLHMAGAVKVISLDRALTCLPVDYCFELTGMTVRQDLLSR